MATSMEKQRSIAHDPDFIRYKKNCFTISAVSIGSTWPGFSFKLDKIPFSATNFLAVQTV